MQKLRKADVNIGWA